MNVLIVDGEVNDLNAINDILSDCKSIQVTVTRHAEKAIEMAREIEFDAIVLSYYLREMNGLEFFLKLKHSDNLSDPCVLLVANCDDERLAEQCIMSGVEDFILKSELNESRLKRSILVSRQRKKLQGYVVQSFSRIKHLAERDQLTGLFNRASYESEVKLRSTDKETFKAFILMSVKINDFPDFIDIYGSKVADLLVVEIANRLSCHFSKGTAIARIDQDTFAVIITSPHIYLNLLEHTEVLLSVLEQDFKVASFKKKISINIATSSLVLRRINYETVLREARVALEHCHSEKSRNIVLYDECLKMQQTHSDLIREGIEHHLENLDFELKFQPIVDSQLQICSLESLVRWPEHSPFGYHSPFHFIAEAEKNGQIVPLGDWIFRNALHQFSSLQKRINRTLHLSINVSPIQLNVANLCNDLVKCCDQHGIKTHQVILEITESAVIAVQSDARQTLEVFVEAGFKIALDDFGTGYSSITHLLDFPISFLKIDRSVVPKTSDDKKRKAILASLIRLGSELSFETIVEGIEQTWQADFCLELGASRLQGFLFSKPLGIEDVKREYFSLYKRLELV